MQDNERLFSKINVVTYLTYTFNSFKVAKFCSNYLNYELIDVHNLDLTKPINNIILVFPIHSEDAPNIIKEVVSKINSKRMIIIRNFCRKYSKTEKNFHPQVFYHDDKTKQTIQIKEFDY